MRKIYFFLFLLIPYILHSSDKLTPLKEITKINDFLKSKNLLCYFHLRCAGLYLSTVRVLGANNRDIGGTEEQINQRNINQKLFLLNYIQMLSYADTLNKDIPSEENVKTADKIAEMYDKSNEEVYLKDGGTTGGIMLEDLIECKKFQDLIEKRSKKKK